MYFNHLIYCTLDTPKLDEFHEICVQFSSKISGWFDGIDLSRLGIYTASSNAGMSASVEFWKLAVEQEPGYMAPINFPWTLANAPSAAIAINLKITGSNYTIIGTHEAALGCFQQASIDFGNQAVTHALLMAFDFAEVPGGSTHITAALLENQDMPRLRRATDVLEQIKTKISSQILYELLCKLAEDDL